MKAGRLAGLVAVLAAGCQSSSPPAPVASASSAPAVASAPTAPAVSAERPARPPPRRVDIPLEKARITKLATEPGGRLVAELDRTPPARAWVTLSTREKPLAPRGAAAHARIAELVAPGLVAPTLLRSVTVKELGTVADAPTRALLAKKARVLADGSVEVALSLAPSPELVKVDLVELLPEVTVTEWEAALGAKEAPTDKRAITLSAYQSLLAADYVAENLARRSVHLHERSGRITAVEGNDAFSPIPKDSVVSNALERLSRHMSFSKRLHGQLGQFEEAQLDKALTWGDPPVSLVTPKQRREAVLHAKALRRLIDQRIKQRGEAAALALP